MGAPTTATRRFAYNQWGWAVAEISPWIVADARRRRSRVHRQRLHRGVMGREEFASGKEWAGLVAEPRVAVWLREEGARVEVNGGHDALPDLVVEGVGVAVKSPVCRSFLPRYHAEVPVQFRGREHAREFFFAGVLTRGDGSFALVLMGGIPVARFWDEAVLLERGARFANGRPVLNSMRRVPFADLEPPREWLARIRSSSPVRMRA